MLKNTFPFVTPRAIGSRCVCTFGVLQLVQKRKKKGKKKLKKFRPSVCGRIRWLPFARMLPLFLSSSPVHCGTLWGRRPSRSTAAYRLHARRFKEEEEGGREKAAGVCSGWGRKKGGVVHHRAEWSGGDVTYRITRNNVYIRAGKMEEREREREREMCAWRVSSLLVVRQQAHWMWRNIRQIDRWQTPTKAPSFSPRNHERKKKTTFVCSLLLSYVPFELFYPRWPPDVLAKLGSLIEKVARTQLCIDMPIGKADGNGLCVSVFRVPALSVFSPLQLTRWSIYFPTYWFFFPLSCPSAEKGRKRPFRVAYTNHGSVTR